MNDRAALLKDAIHTRAFQRADSTRRIITAGAHGPIDTSWIFDFRSVVLTPEWLNAYAEEFWERYADRLPFQVGGMETAAIPLVTAIVMKGIERGTPVNGFYIRKSRDRDGLMKKIEGTLTDDSVILVDDLINSGGSFFKQLKVLEESGRKVTDIFAVLGFRAMGAYRELTERNVNINYLFTLEDFALPLQESHAPELQKSILEEAWKFSAGHPSFEWVVQKSAPAIDATNVYFGTDAGTFFALRQSDGTVAWQFDIEAHPPGKGIFSSPALHRDTVYFGAYDGAVYALDASSGKKKWAYTDADWIGSSPALAPDLDLLFIGLEFGLFRKRGGIAALDMKTGKRVWQDRTSALTHGSPLYIREENLVVIGSNDGIAYAYDAKTGEKRWQYATGGDIKTRPAYDANRRLVLVPSMDSKLYALDGKNGAVRWACQTGAGIYSNPLVRDHDVLVASLDKSLYAITLDDGKRRAQFQTQGRIFASPSVADGALWIGSNDGRLYELDPVSLKSHGHHQFTERIVNAVAYNPATKRLFVATVANELVALSRHA